MKVFEFVANALFVPVGFLFLHPIGWIMLVGSHKAFWWILPGVWSVGFLLSYLHDQKKARRNAQWHKSNYRPHPPPDPRSLDEQFPGWKKKANEIASKIDWDARDRKYEALWKQEYTRMVKRDKDLRDKYQYHERNGTLEAYLTVKKATCERHNPTDAALHIFGGWPEDLRIEEQLGGQDYKLWKKERGYKWP